MSKQRQVLVVWDDENYSNLEEANKDGAITRLVIPSHLSPMAKSDFIKGFIEGLKAAGDRINAYPQKLKCETITETSHSIPVEVLEWNTYHFNVWATSTTEAEEIAVAKGVSLEHNDVEYGTSNYFSEEKTLDRLVK